MKRTFALLPLLALTALTLATAQTTTGPAPSPAPAKAAATAKTTKSTTKKAKKVYPQLKPFSRLGFGAGIGLMGIKFQAATNINQHLNLRAIGNYANYTSDSYSTNGFDFNAKLNMATAGAAIDYYPFPHHGLRLSPGAIFYNQNNIGSTLGIAGGNTVTLDGTKYTSLASDPVKGYASLGLNHTNPTFNLTTGWGNMISRRGGHWSFPFEIGAAFVGAPRLKMGLTSGTLVDPNGNPLSVSDPSVQSNLKAQVNKYQGDLNPYKVYPIIDFGVSYNFSIR